MSQVQPVGSANEGKAIDRVEKLKDAIAEAGDKAQEIRKIPMDCIDSTLR